MIRKMLLVAFVVALAATVRLSAGGWAVITLDSLPESLAAGKPAQLSFMVRQHGMTPLPGLHPWVQAVSGTQEVKGEALPAEKAGQYRATLTLPRAGDWVITVYSGFGSSQLTLLPISAVNAAAGNSVQTSLSPIERGHRLFLAKGCVTCHQNTLGTANQSLNIGPPLVPQKYQPDFLARILANPAAVLPPSRMPVGAMPDLNLQPDEIAPLVAFINSTPTTARR